MSKQTINLPPFPTLRWNKHSWTGEVVLPSWAGFQSRRGSYGSVNSDAESDGTVRLTVVPDNSNEPSHPSPDQSRAFQLLLGSEATVSDSVLNAIYSTYSGMRRSYGYDEEEAKEIMPEIESAKQLRRLIGLSSIYILNVAKDGIAYIGFEFGCTWDGEHGLGVMTHRERVVKVGGADTSFLEWIAENDANPDDSDK
jgi:hypothetical protein